MPPLPSARPLSQDPAPQPRVVELERQLAEAHAEIATLRAERDELTAQLRVAHEARSAPQALATPPSAELVDDPELIDDLVDELPADRVAFTPPLPSPQPAALELDSPFPEASLPPALEFDFDPPSLSRLVVSLPPTADASAAFPSEEGERTSEFDRPSSAERRRRGRLGCEFEVEFLGDTHLITGLSQDISEGGVFVATYQKLAIGSTVTLGLELPTGRVEVRGEVRWARAELADGEQRPGFGVAFTELSPEAIAALNEFCRAHPAHYYEI